MVGANSPTFAADAGDVIACAHILSTTQCHQIAKLRVWAMIDRPIGFHGEDFAVFIGSHFDIHEEWRTLARVLHELFVIVFQINRTLSSHASYTEESFHGGAELVAKSATRWILNQTQFFRFNSQPGSDHGMMQV